MNNPYYNSAVMKKKAMYAIVAGTGSKDYDKGVFYLSNTIKELLVALYFTDLIASRHIPDDDYYKNNEIYFVGKITTFYFEVNLAKLIDKTNKAWSFHQLVKKIKYFNWPDENQIRIDVDNFQSEIKHIMLARHNDHAHTSMSKEPNKSSFRIGANYHNYVMKAMKLLDKFVDGEIPYILSVSKTKECDLRTIALLDMDNSEGSAETIRK